MKQIDLTHGQIALVDDEDYDYLMQWNWCATKLHGLYYACRWSKRKKITMHRIVMNAPQHLFCDHINHITTDNQKQNLRLCTHKENAKNRTGFGKSKYLGVGVYDGYYTARCNDSGSRPFLGCFRLETEAAIAYDIAAMKHHGEFANLNFKYATWFINRRMLENNGE